jgi:hypothetical protein
VAHVSPEGYHFGRMNTTRNLLPLSFRKIRMTIGSPNASFVIGTDLFSVIAADVEKQKLYFVVSFLETIRPAGTASR